MSQHTLAVLDDYQNVSLKMADWTPITTAGVQITVFDNTITDTDALVARLRPFSILCIMRERTKFPASLLAQLPNLKLLVTTGMRNLGLDVEAAKKLGITVCGTQSGGNATSELTWALLLGLAYNIVPNHIRMGSSAPGTKWQDGRIPTGLNGKTLGLIGLGRLGKSMAIIAKAFGMNVIAWSTNMTPEFAAAGGAMFAGSKEELFKQSDFVSVQVVLSPRSVDLVNEAELRLMKKTAFLINTARGPIVNQAALVKALKEDWIAGAALDVYDTEPLPADNELRTLSDKVLMTPHMGYVNDYSYEMYYRETVECVAKYLEGTPIRLL
ncbi:D-isomer specific 2-hydroxyacid dehydrogenase [Limtongia smithiae]|uniref:D-isomer specific 2-hydroxyacid dehydrogenase n=1 Tax=Limtongia smithiae TaxID=1125753 RepID=UPI0034CFFC8A